jgi:hypothetical protein
MRKIIIVMFGLFFYNHCHCQIDCKNVFKNYPNTIDQSKRPVYQIIENMPDIMTDSKLSKFFFEKVPLIENSSKCFPVEIYYGFVVEADGSITNIMICPKFMFCDENGNIDLIKQKFSNQLTAEIMKIKTNAGLLNGKKVAVYTYGRLNCDPQ